MGEKDLTEKRLESFNDMVFRVMGYDGASYRYMLADEKTQRYPVVTIVLNFSQKRWEDYNDLYSCISFDERLKPFINNFKINVIDVSYLSRECINMFKSDFKYVADFFVQQRECGTYKPMDEKTKHTWELLLLMNALTKDERFTDKYFYEHREEGLTMCDVIDKFIEQGVEKGIEKGEKNREREMLAAVKATGKMTNEELAAIAVYFTVEDIEKM